MQITHTLSFGKVFTCYKHYRREFVYWTQNICEPGLRHSKRGKGRWKGQVGSKTHPLHPRNAPGWPPTCVFVTVNEARRYLAASTEDTIDLHWFINLQTSKDQLQQNTVFPLYTRPQTCILLQGKGSGALDMKNLTYE
jgi:hypothetical protein